MEDILEPGKIFIQNIISAASVSASCAVDVLRLDKIHPVISGNKWFKLKYYIEEAITSKYSTIGTFGGPYSNHIVAAAYACRQAGFKSMGIIRGERPALLSDTLQEAKHYGMMLDFVSRHSYDDKKIITDRFKHVYWINEGGYGIAGAKGASDIFNYVSDAAKYTHVVCAVGTGTMMAGLVNRAYTHQQIIGISAMKGNHALMERVRDLLDEESTAKKYKIYHDFHFGGYAKHPQELLDFMNETWQQYQLPTDIVYTSKTFFALLQLIQNNTIPAGSNVLMIHSGGLQGNRSLPSGTLMF